MERERMSGADRAWFRMDRAENPMIITGFFRFEEAPDFEKVERLVRERLLCWDRFHQRLTAASLPLGAGLPRWEEDPNFDLRDHLMHVRLDGPLDDGTVRDFVNRWMSTRMPTDRALWQSAYIEGTDGQAVLVTQIYHCIADGMALMRVLLSLTDETAAESAPNLDLVKGPGGTKVPEPKGALGTFLEVLYGIGRVLRVSLLRPEPRSVLRGSHGSEKRVAWSRPIPVARVKMAGRAAGATINDVLCSAFTGAIRNYAALRGDKLPRDIRVLAPVDLRRTKDKVLGNRFGLVFLTLPTRIADPVERLAELRRRMTALKHATEALATLVFLGFMGVVPDFLQRVLVWFFTLKGSVVLTNVCGPKQARYFGGKKVTELEFWVPQAGNITLGVSIFSYDGKVHIGVNSDASLVPDPEKIVELFEREIDQLAPEVELAHEAPQPPAPEHVEHAAS